MAEARCLVSPARVFARPTADQIWLGPDQQSALSQLSRSVRMRLLTGPTSSGKSTLLNHAAAQIAKDNVVLHCRGPKDTAVGVLSSLLLGADLEPALCGHVRLRGDERLAQLGREVGGQLRRRIEREHAPVVLLGEVGLAEHDRGRR